MDVLLQHPYQNKSPHTDKESRNAHNHLHKHISLPYMLAKCMESYLHRNYPHSIPLSHNQEKVFSRTLYTLLQT